MTRRSVVTVIVLSLLTFGIYALIWQVQTKNELNRVYAAGIPTAWLLLVPFIGPLYVMWKWSEGAEKATGTSGIAVFLLMLAVPIVGIPVMVGKFNQATQPASATAFPVAASASRRRDQCASNQSGIAATASLSHSWPAVGLTIDVATRPSLIS
jgi:hypothetical protein